MSPPAVKLGECGADQNFVGTYRSFEGTLEEVHGGNGSGSRRTCDRELSVQRQGHGWLVCAGIAVCQRATQSSAVADLRVSDTCGCVSQNLEAGLDRRVVHDRVMGCSRPDHDFVALVFDPLDFVNA